MPNLHVVPDLIACLTSTVASLLVVRMTSRTAFFVKSRTRRAALNGACALAIALFWATWLCTFRQAAALFPPLVTHWTQAAGLITGFCITSTAILAVLMRGIPPFRSDRRRIFRAAGAAVLAAPAVVTAFGILERTDFHVSETKLPVPNLPRDLEGLRIVQVTDVHLSAFLSEKQLARVIDMANETRCHLAVMTGDLITRPGDPLDACIRQIGRLRADAGVFGCLGNHEYYCACEDYVTRECGRRGIRFLRSEATDLRFGSATMNLAGVDYQQMHTNYLAHTADLVAGGKLNLLLSHNPDVFRTAAAQGWNVVLAGHTHGGQVNVEILHRNMNVARFYTPWVRGAYHLGGSAIYVSSGIGTIGMPIRLGAPPEISVVQLCAS